MPRIRRIQVITPHFRTFQILWPWAQSVLQVDGRKSQGLHWEVDKAFWENLLGENVAFIWGFSFILVYSLNFQFPEPQLSHRLHGIYSGVTWPGFAMSNMFLYFFLFKFFLLLTTGKANKSYDIVPANCHRHFETGGVSPAPKEH